jgi:hypothetical protein
MDPDVFALESEEDAIAAGFPQVRPIADEAEYKRVREAANADGATILDQTHLVLKGGEIVGSAGLATLPIFTIWLAKKLKARDSLAIVNIVENICRFRGCARVACLVGPDSRFVDVAGRFGYSNVATTTVLMKGL